MKKNLIIIVLLLVTVLSLLYGYIKASEAEMNLLAARENAEEAQRQQELATQAAADARSFAAKAQMFSDELDECRSK